jgi:uncharacterized protein (DUF2141 family)
MLAGAAGGARAQDLVGAASRPDLAAGAGSTRSTSAGTGNLRSPGIKPPMRTPTARSATTVRTVVVPKVVKVTPTTGTLAVAAEPNATILVEPVGGGIAAKGTVPAGERIFTFVDLKPGRYRVAASLDEDHRDDEAEVVIRQGKASDLTLNLPLITHSVTISTNVSNGEIRYALVESRPGAGAGELIYTPVGKTSIAYIQNGRAVLADLPPGTYGVDIRTEEVGYQTLLRRFTVPGQPSYTVALDKKLSTSALSANWDTLKSTWDVPAKWNVTPISLQVRSLGIKPPMRSGSPSFAESGIAVPRNEDYRYYADFDLQSDLKLRNGVGASFVVRARDAQNYYLVQLTGPQATEPYVLRGFIVTGGARRNFGEPQSIRAFASTLNSGQPFTIKMKMRGNKLSVFLTDNETGRTQPAGVLTDPNSTFNTGAIGIAGSDNEEYEVGSFIICQDCIK